MRAAEEALKRPSQPFLLHVDEINRADLAKLLGEAIFLLEPGADEKRDVDLPYDYGPPFGSRLSLPENVHIVGARTHSRWCPDFIYLSPFPASTCLAQQAPAMNAANSTGT
jgi:hypothetical protein